ncbi:phosphoribosylformylglycinamidine cyclo-ligase [Candidatus Peregrinibacteria bacterium]|nr:phosphoribosylformylglycinamidine cyclo-ligase [Candidatus Peregrinibacteria bacterium]
MATYKESGVDISLGDKSSEIAYSEAKKTFAGRKGKIGAPLLMEGGFTGAIDMDNYYLVQNDDGIGSKFQIADEIEKYDTSGYDLAAMVADDAVCVGAECLTISNTIDTEKVDPKKIEKMMKSLSKACREQKIIIPGGEIAELPSMVNGTIWNSTAIGIVEKKKLITTAGVRPGDALIGLYSKGFRSNGFSLVRYILKKAFGMKWHSRKFSSAKTWAETVLEPTQIYHSAILALTGRYKEPRRINVKGISHITGGGIPSNLCRILKKSHTGAILDNLFEPPKMMTELQRLGKVSDEEAYKVWNMGTGMILCVSKKDADHAIKLLAQKDVRSQIIGRVIRAPKIELISKGYFKKEKKLSFSQ